MAKKKLYRTQLVPVRIEHALVHRLDILAITHSKYRSELIREGISDLIKKYDALEKSKSVGRLKMPS